jgi:ribosomal protein S18 acetylase RimI-like enzyme
MTIEENITIIPSGGDDVDNVESLWRDLQTYHIAVAPHLGEARSGDESWRRRKQQYIEWLNEPGSCLLIAWKNRNPVGYVMIRIVEGSETWMSSDQIAEIETFSILPEYRGIGLGSRMMAEIYAFLRDEGIREIGVTVVDTNVDAIRFYQKHGFGNRYVYLWGDVPEID